MAKGTIDERVVGCKIAVRAGMGGENGYVFAYVMTPVPSWAKTADDPHYRALTSAALETAKEVAKYQKKTIILRLSYELLSK